MFRLNKILVALLLVLLLVAGAASIVAADSGSGSVSDDDGSPTEDYAYDDNSNVGSAESEDDSSDDSLDDPLDEYYYGDSDSGSGDSDGFSVNLSKHATSNPLLLLFVAVLSIGALGFKIY